MNELHLPKWLKLTINFVRNIDEANREIFDFVCYVVPSILNEDTNKNKYYLVENRNKDTSNIK